MGQNQEWEPFASLWKWYLNNREPLNPIAAFLGGVVIAWAALRQARAAIRQAGIAARQAETARLRHEGQTRADHQRRITETFGKAIEQLGNDKIEVRVGGIYSLERISRESTTEYWPVMETLCAFVRERTRRRVPDAASSETVARFYEQTKPTKSRAHPPTDIAAVLAVIVGRDDACRQYEKKEGLQFDLRATDLRGAVLSKADLTGINLSGADLTQADLRDAVLSEANLSGAVLSKGVLSEVDLSGSKLFGAELLGSILFGANLSGANLSGADLSGANLSQAVLTRSKLVAAELNKATLFSANLNEAVLSGANFSGADLRHAILSEAVMSGVMLAGARPFGADVIETDLVEADLFPASRATLFGITRVSGTNFSGADLRNVSGLLAEQIAQAHGDARTRLPTGIPRPASWPPEETETKTND